MSDWNKIREDFPITNKYAYFQSAAMSPLARTVFEAIVDNYRSIYELGDKRWDEDLSDYKRMLKTIGGMINTNAENLTFLPNTSSAMAQIALSLKTHTPRPFHIVSLQDEFPASTVGFEYQKISMRYVQSKAGVYSVSSILDLTDSDTLAVVASYIQYATGFRLDARSLGRELRRKNILFIPNATQAFPYYPVDVEDMAIDAMTASLHKWGLTGHIGSLFFTTPSFREKYPPPIAGWLSIDSGKGLIHTEKNVPFSLRSSARCFDTGTFNLQTLLAFRSSLDYIRSIGSENIRERITELTDYLIAGLQKLGLAIISPIQSPEVRSAIVTFAPRMEYSACVKELEKKNILVSPRAGYVRVAVNIFNSFDDIDRLLEALESLPE